MILKLFILGFVGYLSYQFVKSKINSIFFDSMNINNTKRNEIEDVMVQDPYCKVYFAKKDGVHLRINSQILFFCSEECRDKYIEEQK